ncbi:hypothetical protein OG21DRAFT_1601875 [Imleria badia]|nr:hypothetical protein OG21DRAFT_1601875 [Imleria badia]
MTHSRSRSRSRTLSRTRVRRCKIPRLSHVQRTHIKSASTETAPDVQSFSPPLPRSNSSRHLPALRHSIAVFHPSTPPSAMTSPIQIVRLQPTFPTRLWLFSPPASAFLVATFTTPTRFRLIQFIYFSHNIPTLVVFTPPICPPALIRTLQTWISAQRHEFSQARKDATRIERAELERHLKKLIQLHSLQATESKKVKKNLQSSGGDPAFSISTKFNEYGGDHACKAQKPTFESHQEVSRIPPLAPLYQVYLGSISLGKQIEESRITANTQRILDDVALHDAILEYIGVVPCKYTQEFQDRIQLAILTYAGLFKHQNMFPVAPQSTTWQESGFLDSATPLVDPDSELAHALQPLLEQEALLESFVGETMAHRKLEDGTMLKANLKETRTEIESMLRNYARNGITPAGFVAGWCHIWYHDGHCCARAA